jgi:hypothetical protein
MKDFTEQINDAIAPVTRAWCEPELLRAEVRPESFVGEDEIVVAVLVRMRRRESAGYVANSGRIAGVSDRVDLRTETFNESSPGAILPDWTVTGPPPK